MEQGILPSRKELLTRIELVCDLDSSLISVTGDSGIGKSALLEFFIEHHCHDLKKCFVGAQPDIAPYQVRESILSQLIPGSTYDSHLSLAQNLATLAPEKAFKGIFILDNAEYIADEVFYDLIDLMDDGRYQFSVIYAQARDESRQADLNARKALIEIHPEPLDIAESKLLLQFYFGDMTGVDKSQVKQFIIDAEGIPANLLKWQQGGVNQNAAKKKPKQKAKVQDSSPLEALSGEMSSGAGKSTSNNAKLMFIVAGGFLLTVVAVAAWYFKPASQQDIKAELRAKVEKQNKLSAQQDGTGAEQDETGAQEDSSESKADSNKSELNAEDDKTNLDELLVEKWDDNRQVKPEHQFDSPEDKNAEESKVIEVIDLEERSKDETADTKQPAEQTSDSVDSKAVQTPTTQVLTTQAPAKQVPAKQEQTTQAQSANKLMDNEWFLAQAATSAMVQLAGLSDKSVLNRYLQRHQLTDKARIYQSIRNGKPWYVVTLGPYADMNEARSAIGQLSQALQDSRPWAKSIKAIQSEIMNAKY